MTAAERDAYFAGLGQHWLVIHTYLAGGGMLHPLTEAQQAQCDAAFAFFAESEQPENTDTTLLVFSREQMAAATESEQVLIMLDAMWLYLREPRVRPFLLPDSKHRFLSLARYVLGDSRIGVPNLDPAIRARKHLLWDELASRVRAQAANPPAVSPSRGSASQ